MNGCKRFRRLLSVSSTKFIYRHPLCCFSSIGGDSKSCSFLEPEKYRSNVWKYGYSVSTITEIPEYSALAVQLVHKKSGAEHLHIARDDHQNTFSVAFRTVPMDNTGVPHILEHIVLCGSKKYPVQDPFMKMLNRSLSTYMNASTSSTWTSYPFSTYNQKDFENLMSVYLDAVFFPNLEELDFHQEGWRLEHSDIQNVDSEIIFKGVVFNEMKGAFSDPGELYASIHQKLLLPSHTYGYESGGDPLHIPNLTWEDLKHFHASTYHPGNALFFTYGNFPLEDSLKQINDHVLQHFDNTDLAIHIPEEPKWEKPRSATILCSPDSLAPNPDKQNTCSVSYLLGSIKTPFEAFTLSLLSTLMLSGPNSPFFQSLIEPNIGSGYSPVLGIDLSIQNPSFVVGLQGMHSEDKEKILKIIDETIEKVSSEGFDEKRIESIIHSSELAKKHQSGNFGLRIANGVMPFWSHGKDLAEHLRFELPFELLKNTMEENPNYLKDKIKELFMDNPHKLMLEMTPDETYTQQMEDAEKKVLAEKLSILTEEEKQELLKKGLKLEEEQNKVEDISCLPKMSLSDIQREINRTSLSKHLENGNVTVFSTDQPTNGITYFKAICAIASLPEMLKPYLPLFCATLTKLGAGSRDHKELAQRIELTTGGLNVSPHLIPHHTDDLQFEFGISFSSFCLKKNINQMFSLWQDVFNKPHLNECDYLRTIIKSSAHGLAMSVTSSPEMYAMATASKSVNFFGQISELMGGLSQVEFMKGIAEKDDLLETILNLKEILKYMVNANEMRCKINTTKEQMDESILGLRGLLSSFTPVVLGDKDCMEGKSFQSESKDTFIPMDVSLNSVSKVVPGVTFSHEDNVPLIILGSLISSKFLLREIREKGGAYGCGARHGGGLFTFFSYRDPNVTSTLDAFNGAINWAAKGKFSKEDIEEAKLSIISDSPVAPWARGGSQFFRCVSDDMRQKNRDRLFSTDHEDLVRVCNKYLIDNSIQSKTVIGPYNHAILDGRQWDVPLNYQTSK